MPTRAPLHKSNVTSGTKLKTHEASVFRNTSRWQKFRDLFRQKYPLCFDPFYTHAKEGRTIPSHSVHHITPLEDDITLGLDEDNCAALCTVCHARIERMEREGQSTRRMFVNGTVAVIAGPPGSGKSTYVNKYKQKNDIVIDVDALMRALTGVDGHGNNMQVLPLVLACKEACISMLQANGIRGANAWVTTLAPTVSERSELKRRLKAKLIVMAIPSSECIRRVAGDRSRDVRSGEWAALIERWWAEYQPCAKTDDETMVL